MFGEHGLGDIEVGGGAAVVQRFGENQEFIKLFGTEAGSFARNKEMGCSLLQLLL